MNEDKTWEITIRVRATTMCGWKPERSDVEEWLENGTLELVGIESTKEAV